MHQYDPYGKKHRQEVLARKFALGCIAFLGMMMLAAVAIGQAKTVNLGQNIPVAPLRKPVAVKMPAATVAPAPRVAVAVSLRGAR